jgi:hypothetical protein
MDPLTLQCTVCSSQRFRLGDFYISVAIAVNFISYRGYAGKIARVLLVRRFGIPFLVLNNLIVVIEIEIFDDSICVFSVESSFRKRRSVSGLAVRLCLYAASKTKTSGGRKKQ